MCVGLTRACVLVSFNIQCDVSICDVGTFCAVDPNKRWHVERCDGTGGGLPFETVLFWDAVFYLPIWDWRSLQSILGTIFVATVVVYATPGDGE